MEETLWNSVTMKELMDRLEPVKLPTMAKQSMETVATLKAKLEAEPNIAPESAYLGPKLWQKPISLQAFCYSVVKKINCNFIYVQVLSIFFL